ncbi:U-box-domain-containing protein [Delitschia confertaspora ATCC 74209]|uniref:U-box-domain-containing protein n=1 Tax=Delitschia confertaspora ATCC 74209 TaxID=1513339 RepID=A0A9P4JD56_9PLEO|nr:U-box-domain-containing protein [Delitschia confertaspora ATCC 74209]
MPGNEYAAGQLKEKGNAHFRKGEFESAEACYSQAILKNSQNPLLYTNRANARLKLARWQDVIDDCLKSIELMQENMKAYFYLAQAQLSINHPNEALSSALRAYDLCVHSAQQTSNAATISALVLKAKRAKWEIRERERIRRRGDLLGELETKLEEDYKQQKYNIDERESKGEIGQVEAEEERNDIKQTWEKKVGDLRTAFAISDPANMQKREVPDYLIDGITFEIMHDPVVTKTGQSYERATIIEHLKRSPTDPLTREPLTVAELRPNIQLREACHEFIEANSGWIYEW